MCSEPKKFKTITVEELTERDPEQLSEEELAALEEPEYDPEALREILRLKRGGR